MLHNLTLPAEDNAEKKYTLIGVVMHHGLTHYTSFIKNYGNSTLHNSWFHMNDIRATIIDEDKVLDNADAYTFFIHHRDNSL
jgi:ubiquitin C-terminal hydrolase